MKSKIDSGKPRAVVLVSGGLDSCVTAALAAVDYAPALLHVHYGQRTQSRELKAFNDIADALNIQLRKVIQMDYFKSFGGSSLTDYTQDVPVDPEPGEIPSTYVPFRNAALLCAAVTWAEVIGAEKVFIGVNEIDSSGYPDCRLEFLTAFNQVIAAGTRPETHIEVVAPLIRMGKAEIVLCGKSIHAPLEKSWSCYQNEDAACGICDSCKLRLKGFEDAGVVDPIEYKTR